MKRVYVNEDWCLGCHLCEFYCAFANSGEKDMSKAFKLCKDAAPRIRVEEGDGINFAVQCRHCQDPACVKGCIAGALTKNENGVIEINTDKCVGCYTCVLSCPYGCIVIDPKNQGRTVTKCELCTRNSAGEPAWAANCPNRAFVFEERGEE